MPAVKEEALEGDWRFEMSGGEAPDSRIDVNARAGQERFAGAMVLIVAFSSVSVITNVLRLRRVAL